MAMAVREFVPAASCDQLLQCDLVAAVATATACMISSHIAVMLDLHHLLRCSEIRRETILLS